MTFKFTAHERREERERKGRKVAAAAGAARLRPEQLGEMIKLAAARDKDQRGKVQNGGRGREGR